MQKIAIAKHKSRFLMESEGEKCMVARQIFLDRPDNVTEKVKLVKFLFLASVSKQSFLSLCFLNAGLHILYIYVT